MSSSECFLRVQWVKCCLHLGLTGRATTGHKRGQLCQQRSTPLNPPQAPIGMLDFLSVLFFPHPVTARPATGTGFYWATMNDTRLHCVTDDHPKPALSHLLWLQLKGAVSSKVIQQLQCLLISFSRMGLSTLVLSDMTENLFSSLCNTCSFYQHHSVR